MAVTITLTSDFGFVDAYVAAMKGVILGINPDVNLIDICHTIKPQNIPQAAFVLSTAYQFFPRRTIHLVVVDPEVGTERRAIIIRTPAADFVAPDNGVLSYVVQQSSKKPVGDIDRIHYLELEPGMEMEAVVITEPRFWRTPVSPTFHGRDIFAPVAALLSLGFPPINFGPAINSVMMLPLAHPGRALDGSLVGNVLHIDNFGNLITNIRASDLPQTKQPVTISLGDHLIEEVCHTYAEGAGLLALVGSSGYLEISLRGGSAYALLEAEVGSELKINTRR